MAYYPGNYYQTRLWHVGDYYTHGLFGTIAVRRPDDDVDPYADWPPKPHSPLSSHRPSNNLTLSPKLLRDREQPPLTIPCARARTPTPSPPPSPRPSSSYLEFASTPSKTLSSPTRKLLVLDLNGSLLLRSPPPPKSHRGHHQDRQHPAPRRVMRRPYLTALRAYLFASQTRAWLDVMVWSSAQPHSVEDMVLHAFGKDRTWLVAIWARDTLGLEESHYYRNVQTIKDLEKPWAFLGSRSLSSPVPPPEPKSESPSPPTWTGHSAATTLLLDDSFLKTARQPYNHLPVPEYTRAQRNADLASLKHPSSSSSTTASIPLPPSSSLSPTKEDETPEGGNENPRKRKRKTKVAAADDRGGTDDSAEAPTSASAPASVHAHGKHAVPDETLLAVIGILHAARMQSSIAGWLHAGALQSQSQSQSQSQLSESQSSERGAAWYEDPASVHTWARRGRDAMQELQLPVEHGVEP